MNNNFMRSIESNLSPTDIIGIFDEIMVLYNLVGVRDNLSIQVVNEGQYVSFILRFEKQYEPQRMFGSLNGTDFSVYGKKYRVTMSVIDDYNIRIVLTGV